MGVTSMIENIPGVEPFPQLENAWTWSVDNGYFRFVCAVDEDDSYAFQVSFRDSYSPQIAKDVLQHARQHADVLREGTPFAVAAEFDSASDFDCVAALGPRLARLHRGREAELRKATYAVFPAWQCEFSGNETDSEAIGRYVNGLDCSNAKRECAPFLRMRWHRSGQDPVSIRNERRVMSISGAMHTIDKISAYDSSFVECENYRGETFRIDWKNSQPHVTMLNEMTQEVVSENLKDNLRQFLLGAVTVS